MLTDMSSQFTFYLMQEISRLLSFRQLTTSPYHQICNGLVKRLNGPLKCYADYAQIRWKIGIDMLQRFCLRLEKYHNKCWVFHHSICYMKGQSEVQWKTYLPKTQLIPKPNMWGGRHTHLRFGQWNAWHVCKLSYLTVGVGTPRGDLWGFRHEDLRRDYLWQSARC